MSNHFFSNLEYAILSAASRFCLVQASFISLCLNTDPSCIPWSRNYGNGLRLLLSHDLLWLTFCCHLSLPLLFWFCRLLSTLGLFSDSLLSFDLSNTWCVCHKIYIWPHTPLMSLDLAWVSWLSSVLWERSLCWTFFSKDVVKRFLQSKDATAISVIQYGWYATLREIFGKVKDGAVASYFSCSQ